jgi:hypothetical protein
MRWKLIKNKLKKRKQKKLSWQFKCKAIERLKLI